MVKSSHSDALHPENGRLSAPRSSCRCDLQVYAHSPATSPLASSAPIVTSTTSAGWSSKSSSTDKRSRPLCAFLMTTILGLWYVLRTVCACVVEIALSFSRRPLSLDLSSTCLIAQSFCSSSSLIFRWLSSRANCSDIPPSAFLPNPIDYLSAAFDLNSCDAECRVSEMTSLGRIPLSMETTQVFQVISSATALAVSCFSCLFSSSTTSNALFYGPLKGFLLLLNSARCVLKSSFSVRTRADNVAAGTCTSGARGTSIVSRLDNSALTLASRSSTPAN